MYEIVSAIIQDLSPGIKVEDKRGPNVLVGYLLVDWMHCSDVDSYFYCLRH